MKFKWIIFNKFSSYLTENTPFLLCKDEYLMLLKEIVAVRQYDWCKMQSALTVHTAATVLLNKYKHHVQ